MPHLKELVQLHQDDPFALIGINTGDDPDAYREGLEKFGLTWISAYQGEESTISKLYRVTGYPTYFVLDREGVIRATGHSHEEMQKVVERLLAERKAGEDAEKGPRGDG